MGHSHFDHLFGAETILANTNATLVGSYETVRVMEAAGVAADRMLCVSGGETVDLRLAGRPLGVVRGVYEDACRVMAEGFTKALVAAKWTVSPSLHQTRIYSEVVSEQPKPVAYFFVDAMRFEMGVELAERLPKSVEVNVHPAVCALPSITPIGMAALQPGASSSFSVVEQAGTLGAMKRAPPGAFAMVSKPGQPMPAPQSAAARPSRTMSGPSPARSR